jgi:hypothetical protein
MPHYSAQMPHKSAQMPRKSARMPRGSAQMPRGSAQMSSVCDISNATETINFSFLDMNTVLLFRLHAPYPN